MKKEGRNTGATTNVTEVEETQGETDQVRKAAIKMEYTANLSFDVEKDDWGEFVERMDLYFETNEIKNDDKRKAVFLTKFDAKTFSITKKVCAPKIPKELKLEEIIKRMDSYLKPKISETILRQRFRERKQEGNENEEQRRNT